MVLFKTVCQKSKIRESETQRNTIKQDFETHSKHLRDFEIGKKNISRP